MAPRLRSFAWRIRGDRPIFNLVKQKLGCEKVAHPSTAGPLSSCLSDRGKFDVNNDGFISLGDLRKFFESRRAELEEPRRSVLRLRDS